MRAPDSPLLTNPIRPRVAATAYGLRAAISAVLSGGLLFAAGSQAPAVGTIAATVMMVAVILTGSALTWFGSTARIDASSRASWPTAQGAVVLLAGLFAPLVAFPAPLIDTSAVVWFLIGVMTVSGLFDLLGRATGRAAVIAGLSELVSAALLTIILIVKTEPFLLAVIGAVGVVLLLHAGGLGYAAWNASKAPTQPPGR